MKVEVAKTLFAAALLGLWTGAAAAAAPAQQTARADTLQGRVTERDSTAVPSARLTAVGEDGRVFQGRTDAEGRYRIVVPGGGSRYSLTVQAVGYTPLRTVLQEDPGAHRIVRDLRLSRRVFQLDTVHVRPPPQGSGVRAGTPGESFETFSVLTTEIFPYEPGDLEGLASLTPGVLRVGEGEEPSLSIAGQAPDQNRVTVDGAAYGGTQLPAEAMRSVATLVHVYDVSQGQFSGGQIAARTLSGTNRWGGGLSLRVQDPALGTSGAAGLGAPTADRRLFASAGGGGALVRDRLFVYGAADLARSTGERAALDPARADELRRLGVAADSARRFVEILHALGLPGGGATAGTQQERVAALFRLDYAPSDYHSLTFRLDGRSARLDGLGASPLRLAGKGNEQQSGDGGIFAQLASGDGPWFNELRLYHSRGSRTSLSEDTGPAGQVRVGSLLEGLPSFTYLSFGGSPFAPPEERRSLWELSDDAVHESPGHRRKAGFLVSAERIRTEPLQNRDGTFVYQSLGDLRAGRPASFTRLLDWPAAEAVRYSGSLYLGEVWAPSEPLSVVYGLRLDWSRYGARDPLDGSAAALSPTLQGDTPAAFFPSPRVGFTYRVPGARALTVRGGAGAYQGTLPLGNLAALWNATGAGGLGTTLACVGPAAPVPDWDRYDDPEAIPSRCRDGASAFADRAPSVSGFAPDFAAPRSWRTSLGLSGDLARRVTFETEAMLAHGQHLPSALDRNLDPGTAFLLPEEGGRPVYARPGDVDPATGAAAPQSGRRLDALGTVREIASRGESYSGQLTAGVTGIVGKNSLFGLSYTLGYARERTSGVPVQGGPAASTAGDPSVREWGPSSLDRRHSLQLILSDRLHSAVRLGVIAQYGSGLPFTPGVAGDLNADGFLNDRAFVFPYEATPDTVLANGMRRLLDEAPAPVRRCLDRQSGRVAGRNSCRTPGALFMHLKAEIVPRSRRFALTATASNLTAGLDQLLHGRDGLRGWGQFAVPDPTLLEIRGFSPERAAYRYEVNPRFGRSLGGSGLYSPFQITLQARLTLGADPRFAPMAERLALGAAEGPAQLRRRLAEQVRNLPAVVLELDASAPGELALTPAQVELLRTSAAALAPKIESSLSELAEALSRRGPMNAARRARIEESARSAAEGAEAGLRRVREVLTPQQWAQLPAWLLRLEPTLELQRAPRYQVQRSDGQEY